MSAQQSEKWEPAILMFCNSLFCFQKFVDVFVGDLFPPILRKGRFFSIIPPLTGAAASDTCAGAAAPDAE